MKKIILFNAEDQQDLIVESEMIDSKEIKIELYNNCADEEIGEICADADGVITIYSSVNEAALDKMKKCKVIALQSIGYNNIDLKAATRHRVAVANAPGFCAKEVATHAIALILACSRQVVQLSKRVKNGEWSYYGRKIERLQGQTVGLIALGSIPQTMVPMLRGIGMDVIAYAPRTSDEVFERLGIKRIKVLEDILKYSDYVSLHLPLNEKTEDFMNEEKFRMMKKTAYLINTARGGIVDEDALLKAIEEGWIAGAALDVLKDEKSCKSKLINMENVIVTPHMGFYSEGSLKEMREIAMNQVIQVLKEHRLPDNLVNKDLKTI